MFALQLRSEKLWRAALVLAAAATGLLTAGGAGAQSYIPADDPTRDTYVVDSTGTTLYHDGRLVCRYDCAPTAPAPGDRIAQATPQAALPATPMPERVAVADRHPAQPVQRTVAGNYPWPTSQESLRTPGLTLAQAAAPAAPADPVKSSGLTKEQKALILNAGGALAITAYGVGFWDYFQTAPKADTEGWFGRTTKHGGADKLGHFWTTYAVSHLFSYVYRWWDFDAEQANTLGALSGLGVQTIMEVGDAFSNGYGFSYEDALMNVAGAGVAYIMGRYPDLARKIDFRLEYRPKKLGDLADDILTDYENQRYLLALKLDGFDIFHDSALSYLELHAGYYTRGYDGWAPGKTDNRSRNFYFGAGLNVSKLVRNFVDVGIFDYLQVPYTSVGVKKGMD